MLNSEVAWGNSVIKSDHALNDWFWLELVAFGDIQRGKAWKVGTSEPSSFDLSQSWTTQASGYIGCFTSDYGVAAGNFDDFFARKYTEPEPTWGTWGSEEAEYSYTANVAVGVSVVASKIQEVIRAGAVQVGLATTAKRTIMAIRAGTVYVGLAVTASFVKFKEFIAEVIIGMSVTASRLKEIIRTAPTAIGIAATASRLVELIRIGTVTIGEVASAIYTAGLEIIAFVSIGMSVSASKVKELVRVGTTAIGVVVSASWTRLVEGRQLVVKVVTMSYRIVKAVTAAYRKIKAITLGA